MPTNMVLFLSYLIWRLQNQRNVANSETQAALNDLNEAATLCPEDSHVFFNRGHVLADVGRLSIAEADYAKSLHIAPDAETYNARGEV